MRSFRFLALAALLLPVPAAAQPEEVQVGAWAIHPASSYACQAVAQFGDHVAILILEDSTGTGHFIVSDDRWKLEAGANWFGTISWDDWASSQEMEFTSEKAGDVSVLLSPTGSWFTENLAESKQFSLKVPGMGFDEKFDIPETMDVLTAIATCNEQL